MPTSPNRPVIIWRDEDGGGEGGGNLDLRELQNVQQSLLHSSPITFTWQQPIRKSIQAEKDINTTTTSEGGILGNN